MINAFKLDTGILEEVGICIFEGRVFGPSYIRSNPSLASARNYILDILFSLYLK